MNQRVAWDQFVAMDDGTVPAAIEELLRCIGNTLARLEMRLVEDPDDIE
ncbi:hypothetical protein [Streptomyces sp. NPDC001978]